MKTQKPKQGWAIHIHHHILVEWCYDYDERVKAIKKYKPKSEQKTRLKLFRLLPEEAIKDIPLDYRKADQKWQEAHQKWQEAGQKWQETGQKWQEANQKWQEAGQKWTKESKNAFHKKWCGCGNWDRDKINF